MIRQVLAAAFLVAVGVALLILAWPQLFGLELAPFVAQAVSFRGLAAAGAIGLAAIFGVISLVSIGARRLAGGLALLLVAYSGLNLAVLASRGFGEDPGESSDGQLTVLAWNTQGGVPGVDAIAQLALEQGADVIALAETSAADGTEIARLMTDAGRPMVSHTDSFDEVLQAQSTTLIISTELGSYTVDTEVGNTLILPTVIARPDSGDGPSFSAVHPVAPVPRLIEQWRADLTWLASVCEGNMIMAGDFNSTLDHFASFAAPDAQFGQCRDTAFLDDAGGVGTWPAEIPALLGTPIDHVLATPQWRVTDASVLQQYDSFGSDHRPIVARLTPVD